MDVQKLINQMFGLVSPEIAWWQMMVRAMVVYALTVLLVRIGSTRFMAKGTAFDLVLAIILGSVASRAITGNAPFFGALAAALTLVALHWVFAALSFHIDTLGGWLKGRPKLLIRDGELQLQALRHSHITEKDLLESLRIQAKTTDISRVKEARLERSGEISFVLRRSSCP